MIRDPETLKKFEDALVKGEILSHAQALKLFESMWREATTLGVLPSKDPLEGLEVDIRISRIVNSCSKKSSQE